MDYSAIKNQKVVRLARKLLAKRPFLVLLQALLITAAIGLALISLNSKHQSFSLHGARPGLLALGFSVYFIFYLAFALHWAYALFMSDQTFSRAQLLSFFASQPYKYLPSSAFSMSARSIYAKKLGSKIINTAKAQVRENLSLALSGGLLILAVKVNVVLAIVAALILGLATFGLARLKHHQKLLRYLPLIGLSATAWLISAFAFWLIVRGVGVSVDYSQALYLNTITFLASIAAVFVPAGIGVREAILFSQNLGVVPVLTWRICTILVDVISGVVAIFIIHKKK